MDLNKWCADYWKGHCDTSRLEDEKGRALELYALIRRYQAGAVSDKEKEILERYATCGSYRVKNAWWKIKRRLTWKICQFYSGKANRDMAESALTQEMACCGWVIRKKVEKCLRGYDAGAPEGRSSHEDVARSLFGYIRNSIYESNIMWEAGVAENSGLKLRPDRKPDPRSDRYSGDYKNLFDKNI